MDHVRNGMKNRREWLPPLGLRILKSAIAVFLCYVVAAIRGNAGIVFYSMLAALWCIQVYVSNTKKNALQRFLGTVIGALYGLTYLLLTGGPLSGIIEFRWVSQVLISLMIVVVLYTTVVIRKKEASYFSCVVFLSIVVNHVTDANPYLFVWNRFLDTLIGMGIGVGVNCFSLPKERRKDLLFVSGLDDTILNRENNLTDYGRIELNRMLDDGINLTIATIRSPAALWEGIRGIRIKMPVIAMDGALLLDVEERRYLKVYVISAARAGRIVELVKREGLNCFVHVVMDDVMLVYHDQLEDETQKKMVEQLRRSAYENYLSRPLPSGADVACVELLYPKEIILRFQRILEEEGVTRELKVVTRVARDNPGYLYLDIYNRNASKENMIAYLMQMYDVRKTVTFGTIEGKYDVVIKEGDTNRVVHTLRKLYEPIRWKARKE